MLLSFVAFRTVIALVFSTIGSVCGKKMSMARYDVEKFDGKSDFGLWRIKMEPLLIHQGLDQALEEKPDDDQATGKRQEILRKARSAIFLSLDDKVLREVAHEKTACAVWKKLEELYMVKSLANRLYMKQQLYNYRFVENKPLNEQLDSSRSLWMILKTLKSNWRMKIRPSFSSTHYLPLMSN